MTGGPVERAAALSALGHRGPLTAADVARLVDAAAHDPDPRPRAAAVGALVRRRATSAADVVVAALGDGDAAVRRRAAELVPAVAAGHAASADALVASVVRAVDDHDVTVVEAAAWALGELGGDGDGGDALAPAVDALARVAEHHRDPLAREAAVAALGALGDPRGLAAVLHACHDRTAVRRRAVLALAPFSGPDVDAALAGALDDRDWQVRQAAQDVLGRPT